MVRLLLSVAMLALTSLLQAGVSAGIELDTGPAVVMAEGDPAAARCEACLRTFADRLTSISADLEGHADVISCTPPEHTSEHPLVIGAGMGTTATRGVAQALCDLGLTTAHFRHVAEPDNGTEPLSAAGKYRHYSGMRETSWLVSDSIMHLKQHECNYMVNSLDWTVYDEVDAVLDWPHTNFWHQMYMSHPNAKVLLTTRDPVEWAKKRRQVHRQDLRASLSLPPWPAPCETDVEKFLSVNVLSEALLAHNAFVRCMVPAENLLEVNLFHTTSDEAWRLLTELVGLPGHPATREPFPHGFADISEWAPGAGANLEPCTFYPFLR